MKTANQAAQQWAVSPQRVRVWLKESRIPGAVKIGRDWLIPADAKRPVCKTPRQEG